MASILKHLRSSTANKRPTASGLADGQIAINTASGTPALFFKDSASNIVKVGPAHVGATAPNTSPAGSAGNSTGELWVDTGLTTNGLKYYNGTAFVNLTPSGTTSTIGLVELATDAETQAGTDAARAVTPSGLQSKISDSTSTSSSTTIASSTAVKSAYDLADAALPKAGGTITGAVTISPSGSLVFEGATDDGFETTIAVVDPTADRTITLPNVTGTVVTTGDSGTVTSTMILDGTILNADVNASAAIAGTKISPDFGSQNTTTTGTSTAASFIPTSSGVPTNGLYLPSANNVAISTNGTGRLFIDSSGRLGLGTSSPDTLLHVVGASTLDTDINYGFWTGGVNTQPGLFIGGNNTTDSSIRYSYIRSASPNGTARALRLQTGTDTRLTITSAGNVGIGTTSPSYPLSIFNSASNFIQFSKTGDAVVGSLIGRANVTDELRIQNSENAPITLSTNNLERARIDSSGRLLVGTSSSTGVGGSVEAKLQVADTSLGVVSVATYANSNNPAYLMLGKSRGTTTGSFTVVQANDGLGEIRFAGADGTDLQTPGASIKGEVDGTPGANDMPGRLVFSTTADGASSPTERMRIDSSGRVGIGTASPDTLLHLSAIDGALKLQGTRGTGASATISTGGTNSQNLIITASTDLYLRGTQQLFQNLAGTTEYMRLDSSGRLGLGTSGPSSLLHLQTTSTNVVLQMLENNGSTVYGASLDAFNSSGGNLRIRLHDSGGTYQERFRITSTGNVGIGTTSPSTILHISSASPTLRISDTSGTASNLTGQILFQEMGTTSAMGRIGYTGGDAILRVKTDGAQPIVLATNDTERARIDSSGRLLVGTSSTATAGTADSALVQVKGATGGALDGRFALLRNEAATAIGSGENIGIITFGDSAGNEFARVTCTADADAGSGDYPGRLVFSTTADGASSPTERMRISNVGQTYFNTTNADPAAGNVAGVTLQAGGGTEGTISLNRDSFAALLVGRKANDGALVNFYQDGTAEGSISVSGTTVSYNGAHLSRWSQLPGGAVREEILRGTVLSNIDEMCGWGEEDNEQLNRMKVSDVEGDPNVSGVFQSWDDDDDTYTDDFYCAMTGDFIIRIAGGVTVQRGDLLVSAGDGTAKPQDDDIIRSKTIAKVTSTHVTCTYDDGSYCVPCVLMAC